MFVSQKKIIIIEQERKLKQKSLPCGAEDGLASSCKERFKLSVEAAEEYIRKRALSSPARPAHPPGIALKSSVNPVPVESKLRGYADASEEMDILEARESTVIETETRVSCTCIHANFFTIFQLFYLSLIFPFIVHFLLLIY